MTLETYQAKRNFKSTPEPKGSRSERKTSRDSLAGEFVVQKHAASRLHYDFRLAMEGVLKSWAVPKGFPHSKGDKRLAVQVEDHPLDYAGFEGTIAPGNYGAGTVMLWDRGRFRVDGGDAAGALAEGKLHLFLEGRKLQGEWTLVRLKPKSGERDESNWLLLKSGESVRPISKAEDDRSVESKRSMRQIAAENAAQWQSDRAKGTSRGAPPRAKAKKKQAKETAALDAPKGKPAFVEPMKALLKKDLPKGKEWIYEIKFDGYRALAIKNKDSLQLWSRNRKPLHYPEIEEGIAALAADQAVLDGEIVALDSKGRPTFQLLQQYHSARHEKPPLFFYAFDLLHLNGHDLTSLPLDERKQLLEQSLPKPAEQVRFSASLPSVHASLLEEMKGRQLEGLIAKKRTSRYESGRRSGSWVKFKWTNEQEFVIGGFTPPEGSRSHLGAVLVGLYEDGELHFSSKVGTGFTEAVLEDLHGQLLKRRRSTCPFSDLRSMASRTGQGLSSRDYERAVWVKPELVCQIKFTEWTSDGHLRHPVFLGLRQDKDPREVVREVSS